jgi:small subunit ribosomal protein S2
MKRFIFTEQNDIYIINLQKTLKKIYETCEALRGIVARRETVLFVGTKKQAQEIVREEAQRCNMFYITDRWLGGMLTNYKTISHNIEKLRELERMKSDGTYDSLPKKEVLSLEKKRGKLEQILVGIKDMGGLPGAVFVVDIIKEKIAVSEARKLGIPVIGIVDTNADPDQVDFPIPANDDAIRSIKLITQVIADTIIEARRKFDQEEEMKSKHVTSGAASDHQATAKAMAAQE